MEEYPAGSRLGVSTRLNAEVTRISLGDYPRPLYDADLAHESGPPENALRLKRLMSAHQGVFITSPEYNASITPILKNAIDWISAAREHGEPALAAYQNRVSHPRVTVAGGEVNSAGGSPFTGLKLKSYHGFIASSLG